MEEPETTTGWGDDPDKPYADVCKERAGTTLFWLVDNVPVREQYSTDGQTSQRFGLKEGQWVPGYPGESTFFENASRVEQADFDAAVNKSTN